MVFACNHNIRWFEIAEDDSGYPGVKIIEYGAELERILNDLCHWQFSLWGSSEDGFQRLAFDVVHDKIAVLLLFKIIIDTWEVWMHQTCKYVRFLLKSRDSLLSFLSTQQVVIHFFDGSQCR